MKIQHELANVTGGFAAGVDGGPSRPYYTSYPISYYPHYLILLPTYFMAGLQIIVDESAAPGRDLK